MRETLLTDNCQTKDLRKFTLKIMITSLDEAEIFERLLAPFCTLACTQPRSASQ